ncbi:hypothetical protein A0H81_13677 [Grifola frondosa]|uniref:Uncharacterized protein n=1 Tax=Grifola frondosa TaxID=5627 RepID=A0A1C7LU50_GRIFR|nr:hypothetical protein A0H81_13677 [Grifola frondosa]
MILSSLSYDFGKGVLTVYYEIGPKTRRSQSVFEGTSYHKTGGCSPSRQGVVVFLRDVMSSSSVLSPRQRRAETIIVQKQGQLPPTTAATRPLQSSIGAYH